MLELPIYIWFTIWQRWSSLPFVPRARKPRGQSGARQSKPAQAALKAVGTRVRAIRVAKGLTMADIAPAAMIDEKHIQLIETAKTNASLATLACLADALGVPLSDLFEVQPDSKKN